MMNVVFTSIVGLYTERMFSFLSQFGAPLLHFRIELGTMLVIWHLAG